MRLYCIAPYRCPSILSVSPSVARRVAGQGGAAGHAEKQPGVWTAAHLERCTPFLSPVGEGARAFAGLVPRLTGSFFHPLAHPCLWLPGIPWAVVPGSGKCLCGLGVRVRSTVFFLAISGSGQSLWNISQYRLGVWVVVGWGGYLGSTRTKCNRFLCHSVFRELSATECSVCFLIVVIVFYLVCSFSHRFFLQVYRE